MRSLGCALCQAQRRGFRLAWPSCDGLPAETGSRPGGRGTFFVRTKKVPKESRPASTPRASRTVPCAAQSIVWLRNSPSLRSELEQSSPPPLRVGTRCFCAARRFSGGGKASTINRCRTLVAWMEAKFRTPGRAVERSTAAEDYPSLDPTDQNSTGVAPQMVLTCGSRRERRTEASTGGVVRTRCLRREAPSSRGRPTGDAAVRAARRAANAGSSFLGYFF